MYKRSTASEFGMILLCARGLRWGLVVAAVMVHWAAAAGMAQTASQSRTGTEQARTQRPDFSGVWARLRGRLQISNSDMFHPDEPPLTPWAEEKYRVIRKGIADPSQQAREDIDPILEPYCMTPGFPRIYLRPGAVEIVQLPNALYMNFDEHSQSRRIYMDGRKHPANAPPSFMGHSIGWWDGDTIVVETVGLNDLTWLDGMGHPHSTELRVDERIRKTAQNMMKVEFLFEDPKAFTRPWSGEKLFEYRPDWQLMEYTICEDSTGEAWWKALEGEGVGNREP